MTLEFDLDMRIKAEDELELELNALALPVVQAAQSARDAATRAENAASNATGAAESATASAGEANIAAQNATNAADKLNEALEKVGPAIQAAEAAAQEANDSAEEAKNAADDASAATQAALDAATRAENAAVAAESKADVIVTETETDQTYHEINMQAGEMTVALKADVNAARIMIAPKTANIYPGTFEQGTYAYGNGAASNSTTLVRTTEPVPVLPNVPISILRTVTTGQAIVRGYDKDGNYIGSASNAITLISGGANANNNYVMPEGEGACTIMANDGVYRLNFVDYSNDLSQKYTVCMGEEAPKEHADYDAGVVQTVDLTDGGTSITVARERALPMSVGADCLISVKYPCDTKTYVDRQGEGAAGVTFIPNVSADGVISWTNDGGLANPEPVDITGPQGPVGPQGEQGPAGPQGPAGKEPNEYKRLATISFTENASAFTITEIDEVPISLKEMVVIMDRLGDGESADGFITTAFIVTTAHVNAEINSGYHHGIGANGNCWYAKCAIDGDCADVESAAMINGTNNQIVNGWMANNHAQHCNWRRLGEQYFPFGRIIGFTIRGAGQMITAGSTMWIYGKE